MPEFLQNLALLLAAQLVTSVLSLALIHATTGRPLVRNVLSLALVVAYARIHLGAHYPRDVLFGAVIGLLVAATTLAVAARLVPIDSDLLNALRLGRTGPGSGRARLV